MYLKGVTEQEQDANPFVRVSISTFFVFRSPDFEDNGLQNLVS